MGRKRPGTGLSGGARAGRHLEAVLAGSGGSGHSRPAGLRTIRVGARRRDSTSGPPSRVCRTRTRHGPTNAMASGPWSWGRAARTCHRTLDPNLARSSTRTRVVHTAGHGPCAQLSCNIGDEAQDPDQHEDDRVGKRVVVVREAVTKAPQGQAHRTVRGPSPARPPAAPAQPAPPAPGQVPTPTPGVPDTGAPQRVVSGRVTRLPGLGPDPGRWGPPRITASPANR